jgi:hypothetical protein
LIASIAINLNLKCFGLRRKPWLFLIFLPPLARLARDLGIRRNLIYKWREQLNTKQDKALKRTANNADTPYHKAAHSELLQCHCHEYY